MEQGFVQDDLARHDFENLLAQLAPFDIKLKPPDLRGRTVERGILDEETIDSLDIVVLTAGAGYGKTTLLAQSIRSRTPWAWLTLHPEDNDPATLVAYLLRALQTAWPLPADQVGHLSDPGASEASILLPRLSRLIESIRGRGILVLDEINAIEDARCLRILETVLESAPRDLHVLLSGRSLPPLGLERLRTRRRILELHEDDLAFTYTESLALVDAAQLSVNSARLRRIHQVAEGWPAGIYLLALASQGSELPPIASALSVEAYVQEQVLSSLDGPTVEFLVRTSVLDVPDGPSCDALLGRSDSASVLARLSRSHLFVAPVQGLTDSYRYHGLLSDVLRSDLKRRYPEELRGLHARASDHFAARGEREAAVRHALSSGDAGRAAALAWSYVPFMLGIGKGDTLTSWFRGISDTDYDATPVFPVAQAIVSCLFGDGRQARLRLALAQRHAPDTVLPDGVPLQFYLNVIEALIGDKGVSEMVRRAEAALALDVEDSPFRNLPLHLKGCGLALSGDVGAAIPALDEGIEIAVHYPAAVVSGLAQKAVIAIADADWVNARYYVQRGRELYEHFRLENMPPQARFNAVAAMVAVHDGDLELAATYARHGRVLVGRLVDIAPWLGVEARIMLGQVELRLGRIPSAAQLAAEAQAVLKRVPDGVSLAQSLRALEDALGTNGGPSEALTTAEIRLLSFLPTHLTFSQIADELYVSVNTVKSQAKAIYRKLDAVSRRDVVSRATASGLLGT